MRDHPSSAMVTPKVSKSLIVISSSSHIFDLPSASQACRDNQVSTSTQRRENSILRRTTDNSQSNNNRNINDNEIELGFYTHTNKPACLKGTTARDPLTQSPPTQSPPNPQDHEVFIGNFHDIIRYIRK